LAAAAIAALGLCACASSGGGAGHDGGEDPPIRALLSADVMLFVSFDADGDLRVTQAELDAGIAREFARAEANHDGQIQPLEFQAWQNAALGGGDMGPYRLDFDRNVDNVITRQEFHDELAARARHYDEDGDGVLTRKEFVREVNQTRRPSGPPAAEQRRRGPGPGGG
jgi:hypothetical protein